MQAVRMGGNWIEEDCVIHTQPLLKPIDPCVAIAVTHPLHWRPQSESHTVSEHGFTIFPLTILTGQLPL